MNEHSLPSHKSWYKKRKYWILGILALVIIVVFALVSRQSGQGTTYETAVVTQGNLKQTVEATGNVESANEIELRFEASGKVAKIYKQAGDSVKPGETIAIQDLAELNAKVGQAQAEVAKAQANLNKEIAGSTDQYLAGLKAKWDQAEANLNQIKATYDASLAEAKAALETAENNLKLVEGGEESQIVTDAYSDLVTLLLATQDKIAGALIEVDNILGVDNSFANDSFEKELGNIGGNALSLAINKYHGAKVAKADMDSVATALSLSVPHSQIDFAAETAAESLLVVKEMLLATADLLNKTLPLGNLTQTSLDTLKTDIQTARNTIATQYTSLVDQRQEVAAAKNSYNSYSIAYTKAVEEWDSMQKKAAADVAAYAAAALQAKAGYEDSKNPPREVDLASYRAALASAQASLAQSVANRNRAMIIAPVEGVIGKVDLKVGQYVSSQDAVVKIVNPHFEVKVDISETDIVKIALGNTTQVTLDAYGDDVVFPGTVTEIEIGETVIQDVVYYTVTLTLGERPEYKVLNGMTANVIFFTEEKTDVLSIPLRAVRAEGEKKYVRVLTGDQLQEVGVKTGLKGDNGMVEIVEGLAANQVVVLRVIEEKK